MEPTLLPSMDVDTAAARDGDATLLLGMRCGMTTRPRSGHSFVTFDARPGTVA